MKNIITIGFVFLPSNDNKKCVAPNETTHEKRRASFAATQSYEPNPKDANMEGAFLPKGKTHPRYLALSDYVAKSSYHTTLSKTISSIRKKMMAERFKFFHHLPFCSVIFPRCSKLLSYLQRCARTPALLVDTSTCSSRTLSKYLWVIVMFSWPSTRLKLNKSIPFFNS